MPLQGHSKHSLFPRNTLSKTNVFLSSLPSQTGQLEQALWISTPLTAYSTPQEPRSMLPRGTRAFLEQELDHAKLKELHSKKTGAGSPRQMIRARAISELDPFFLLFSNKEGLVTRTELQSLIPLATSEETRRQLEALEEHMLKRQVTFSRQKFLKQFSHEFYVKPLLLKIESEASAINTVQENVPFQSVMKAFIRRQNFQVLHRRYKVNPIDAIAQKKKLQKRRSIAKKMFKAAAETKTIEHKKSIELAFSKHQRLAHLHPERDGIEKHELCSMHIWSLNEETAACQCACVYEGPHAIHDVAVNDNSIFFATSYGDLMEYKIDDARTSSLLHNNRASTVDVTWGRRVRSVAISKHQRAVVVAKRLYTWGENNDNFALGHPIQTKETRKMTIPDTEELFHDVKESQFLNISVYRGAKAEYDEEHRRYCKAMSMERDGYAFLIELPLKAQAVWKRLLALLDKCFNKAGPRMVHSLHKTHIDHVVCSEYHILALSSAGKVFSWGTNEFGCLGLGTTRSLKVSQPTEIKTFTNVSSCVKQVACGEKHCVAVLRDGKVFSWGCSTLGQLGHADYDHIGSPAMVQTLQNIPIVRVSVGKSHNIALTAGGEIWSWGSNWSGQLGRKIPINERSLSETAKIAKEKFETEAAETGKEILPLFEARTFDPTPRKVLSSSYEDSFVSVDAAWNGTCAITNSNKLLLWGETINFKDVFYGGDSHLPRIEDCEFRENYSPHEVNWEQLVSANDESWADNADHKGDHRLLRASVLRHGIMIVSAQNGLEVARDHSVSPRSKK